MRKTTETLLNPYLLIILITFLSLMPKSTVALNKSFEVPNLDKLIHFAMYFVLTFSILLKLYFQNTENKRIKQIIIFISVTLYSYGLEIMQGLLIEGRQASLFDLAANALGSLTAIILFKKLNYFYQSFLNKIENIY